MKTKNKLIIWCSSAIVALLLFWGTAFALSPVYITDNGEKYHGENCQYLEFTKSETTRFHATTHGYSKCSICKGKQHGTKI